MRARPRRFFSALQLIELSPPLVKASRPYPELLGQFRDTLTGPHPLYSYALKLPGVSFPLHLAVPFPAKCALPNCLTSRVQSIPLVNPNWPCDGVSISQIRRQLNPLRRVKRGSSRLSLGTVSVPIACRDAIEDQPNGPVKCERRANQKPKCFTPKSSD